MQSPTQTPFELKAGHPVLDFINTLDDRFMDRGPRERLASYADLVRFCVQAGVLSRPEAQTLEASVSAAGASRALRSARALREALAVVLYGQVQGRLPEPAQLAPLERHFKEASRRRELRASDIAELTWTWKGAARQPELPVWLLAEGAAELLLSPALRRVRACEADTCRWLFLDSSKSHTRRWCDMKVCGNRMKARRFQERHA